MTAFPGARTCPQCGEASDEELPYCTRCGASMSAPPTAPASSFCGECGAQLEPGLRFCGECGTPVPVAAEPAPIPAPAPRPAPATPPSAINPAELRWAPPSTPKPSEPPAPEKKKFCRGCGAQLKADAQFCRKCGRPVRAEAAKAAPKSKPQPAAPAAKALPPADPPKALPAGPGMVKKSLRVIVPVGSMAATYFLTYRFLGPTLIAQFGDAGRQMVPMLISMAVGGITRQITK